ncbi:phosphatidylinositol polyphosphate 5-phosphatase type IV-like [Dendropsophus ebraccatus]|uniref:phosphatidylinositol polyphosphate 5-phosphatase type IV-like n=1 Tax=Dendropsophus ebraccatus TaxID=150705 RepID=UPI003831644D
MPFWRKSKKYKLSQNPKQGDLDEPNVKLTKYTSLEAGPSPVHKTKPLPSMSTDNIRNWSSDSHLIGDEELSQHFPDKQIKLYIATWNMGGQDFPENLQDLLLPPDDTAKDVYVIGIQEGCPNRREWEIKLQETLGPHFVLYKACGHGVMYLTIFIRRELIWFCSEVEEAKITTRLFHQFKTKGALGVSFTIFGTSFLFIASHLRYGSINKRIEDYRSIIQGLHLPRTKGRNDSAGDVTNQFHHVFWFGDLNFQLQEERNIVESLLKNNKGRDVSNLLVYDSLNEVKSKGTIFDGFKEHTIEFRPTYKFDLGTEIYDTSAKQRIPSYTDRVLYKTKYEDNIKVIKYDSCPLVRSSDHRPVFATFQVKLEPGHNNIPLSGGQFDREAYTIAIRRKILPI